MLIKVSRRKPLVFFLSLSFSLSWTLHKEVEVLIAFISLVFLANGFPWTRFALSFDGLGCSRATEKCAAPNKSDDKKRSSRGNKKQINTRVAAATALRNGAHLRSFNGNKSSLGLTEFYRVFIPIRQPLVLGSIPFALRLLWRISLERVFFSFLFYRVSAGLTEFDWLRRSRPVRLLRVTRGDGPWFSHRNELILNSFQFGVGFGFNRLDGLRCSL